MIQHSAAPKAVLVVEDEPLQRTHMEEILAAEGLAVIAVSNATQALAALNKRNDIAVVVTDIRMPGDFDGLIVAWRAASAAQRRAPLPVIIVSAFVHPWSDLVGGNFRLLPKPLDPARLVQEVRQALAAA